MKNIGARIKSLRKSKGWSLEKLADKAGTSKSYLWEIEKSRTNGGMSAVWLRDVAIALGTTASHLTGEEAQVVGEDKAFVNAYMKLPDHEKLIMRKLLPVIARTARK